MTRSVTILTFSDDQEDQRDERYAPESEKRPADHRRGRTTQGQNDGARDNGQQPDTTSDSRYHVDNVPHPVVSHASSGHRD